MWLVFLNPKVTNPNCEPAKKFKMVVSWGSPKRGATMFASVDGFHFKNLTVHAELTGSDSQYVVFWDAKIGNSGAYV